MSTGKSGKQELHRLNFVPEDQFRLSSPSFQKRRSSSLIQTAATGDSRSQPFKIDGKTSYSDKDRVGDDEGDKYYRFKLSQKREVKIEVENNESIFGPSLDFRLLDKNGNKIKSVNVDGNDEDDIKRELNKGTYYIKIESNGESVPYELKYKSESIDDDDDDDDDD